MLISVIVFISMMGSYFLGVLTGIFIEKTKAIKRRRKEIIKETERRQWNAFVTSLNIDDHDV
jgi:hypothetical protein